jgi:pyruvate kinase
MTCRSGIAFSSKTDAAIRLHRQELQRASLQGTAGGVIKSAKGINLPNTPSTFPPSPIGLAVRRRGRSNNDLDYLALSFVRTADDLTLLREHLRNKSSDIT